MSILKRKGTKLALAAAIAAGSVGAGAVVASPAGAADSVVDFQWLCEYIGGHYDTNYIFDYCFVDGLILAEWAF